MQQFVRSDSRERWGAYVLAGALNALAGEVADWELAPFSGVDGWWHVAVQSGDEEVCRAFRLLFERAGYKVF